MNEIVIQLKDVSKEYQLGAIGGTTLREELHRWTDKMLGRQPQLPTGRFLALDGVNLTIRKGERVGIIGHNGAGKSTLLKLLSRVTSPSAGTLSYSGRISSMLEVGTGFHPELSGRENIYMNGAILGMSKKEIDSKLDAIVEFSEIGQFIDTPVKRYSSGMYVKLAFAVAAHLDNEILIMDEVLAVGDMKFQDKCLDKMNNVSLDEGRTVLYVSHNMNTIRQLCNRCIVLDHGRIIYDGDVEEAVSQYLGIRNSSNYVVDLKVLEREPRFANGSATMEKLTMENVTGIYEMNSILRGILAISSARDMDNVILSVYLLNNGVAVTCMRSEPVVKLEKDQLINVPFEVDLSGLAPGKYTMKLALSTMNGLGGAQYYDVLTYCYVFSIIQQPGFNYNQKWNIKYHGYLTGRIVRILQE